MERTIFYNSFYLILAIITTAAVMLFIIYMVDKYGSKALKTKKGDNPARPIGWEDNINGTIESVNCSISRLLITSEAIKEQTILIKFWIFSLRILFATSVFETFKRLKKGNVRLEIEGTKLPPLLTAKDLQVLITQGISEQIKLIGFVDGPRGKIIV